jgi:hypothetical protein
LFINLVTGFQFSAFAKATADRSVFGSALGLSICGWGRGRPLPPRWGGSRKGVFQGVTRRVAAGSPLAEFCCRVATRTQPKTDNHALKARVPSFVPGAI